MKVKYIVAHFDETECRGSSLASVKGAQSMEPGWYRLRLDDEGRQTFESGPHPDAKLALGG
jgi:hypothetical protein